MKISGPCFNMGYLTLQNYFPGNELAKQLDCSAKIRLSLQLTGFLGCVCTLSGTAGSVRGTTLIWTSSNTALEIQKERLSSPIHMGLKTAIDMFSINIYIKIGKTTSALLCEHYVGKQSSSWWHWAALSTPEKKTVAVFLHELSADESHLR